MKRQYYQPTIPNLMVLSIATEYTCFFSYTGNNMIDHMFSHKTGVNNCQRTNITQIMFSNRKLSRAQ